MGVFDGANHEIVLRKLMGRSKSCATTARFPRQLFWHGARLILAPVPKILGPAPSFFCHVNGKSMPQNIRGPRLLIHVESQNLASWINLCMKHIILQFFTFSFTLLITQLFCLFIPVLSLFTCLFNSVESASICCTVELHFLLLISPSMKLL